MKQTLKEKIQTLPDSPGVYFFYNSEKECIYIGKATSLKSRVRSYWSNKKAPVRPIEEMLHEVVDMSYKVTDSAIEAAILEGMYIKKMKPKYNVLWKDDRSWNYIVITNDEYPQVQTVREHELRLMGEKEMKRMYRHVFGPYPGLHTKPTLKLLYRLFQISSCSPTSDSSAKKADTSDKSPRPCFYYQMGQCLGVCTRLIPAKEYKAKVIRPLTLFLKGGKKQLLALLEKRMHEAAKENNFEEAGRIRDQIVRLQHIHDMAVLNKSFVEDIVPESVLRMIHRTNAQPPHPAGAPPTRGSDDVDFYYQIDRIEGYDISNLGATGIVGSMVVFDTHGPVKSQYRKFKMRTLKGQSDVDALDEMLRRRLNHAEWPLPDMFLIDGGKPQVNRVVRVLKDVGIKIPVVGIAKGSKRKRNDFFFGNMEGDEWKKVQRQVIAWVQGNKTLLIQVRDEAHRFAISYQRSLRRVKK